MKPTDLERWDRPLVLLLLGFWLVVTIAATFVSNGATRIYSWPWAFYLQAALLAPWFWCAWSNVRGRTGLRSGWYLALPLLAALAISIFTSAHWRDALEASLVLATPLFVLPFVAQAWVACSTEMRLLALRSLGALLAALSAWSLVTWLAQAPDADVLRWFFSSRNPHPLGHWNYTGGLALLALPVTVLLATRERGTLRLIWCVSTVLGLLLLLSAGSRGATLGLIAALVLAAAVLVLRRSWSGRTLAAGVCVLAAVVVVAVWTNPRLRQIATDPSSAFTAGKSEQERLGFILTGVNIARAHALTGIGPGTTPYHYPQHRVDIPGSLENSFQLHCGPLQWWVDTGFVGLAALAFAGATLKWRTWRNRRRLTPEAIAAIALLGGYGVMWLTDHQLDAPIFPIVLALAVGVLLAETGTPSSSSPGTLGSRATFLAPAIVLVPLICTLLLVPSWRARAEFSTAWVAKDLGDPNAFLKHLRGAADLAPWQPLYHNHLARALAGVAAHLPPETAAALRTEARARWQHSVAVAPAQDHPWLNLGWLDFTEGRASEAAVHFARAAAIQPRRSGVWYATAQAQFALNDGYTAARALAREVRLDPSFITSPLWRDEPFASARPTVLAQLVDGWLAIDGDPGAAPAPDIAALARWWWTGDVIAPSASDRTSPTQQFLAALPRINDRDAELDPGILPPGLHTLRETWRTKKPITTALVSNDLAHRWTAHVVEHHDDSFSLLLKTFAQSSTRRIQRGADGILFRQLDGDPLTDLTEIPANDLMPLLRPILPPPSVDEFLDGVSSQSPTSPRG